MGFSGLVLLTFCTYKHVKRHPYLNTVLLATVRYARATTVAPRPRRAAAMARGGAFSRKYNGVTELGLVSSYIYHARAAARKRLLAAHAEVAARPAI